MLAMNFAGEQSMQALVALADIAIKGMLILAAAAVGNVLLRRAGAAVRHLVWSLALAGLVALPALSLALPKLQVPILPAWARAAVNPPAPADAPKAAPSQQPTVIAPGGDAPPALPRPEHFNRPAVEAGGPAVSNPPTATIDSPPQSPAAAPRSDAPPAAPAVNAPSPQLHWSAWMLLVWLAGAAAVAIPFISGTLIAWWRSGRAARVKDASWLDLLSRIQESLSIRRPVVLLRSAGSGIPFTWGLRRPVIMLPAESDDWTDQRRRAVLLHELAHVKRLDCLTQLIAHVAIVIHWFNPLAWLAGRIVRIERERACDDLVLSAGMKPSDYASHLLDIVRTLRSSRCPSLAAVAMARKSQFEGRMRAILDPRRSRRTLTRWLVAAAALVLVGVVVPVACMRATSRQGPPPGEPTAAHPDWPRLDEIEWASNEASRLGYRLHLKSDGTYELRETWREQAEGPATGGHRPTTEKVTNHSGKWRVLSPEHDLVLLDNTGYGEGGQAMRLFRQDSQAKPWRLQTVASRKDKFDPRDQRWEWREVAKGWYAHYRDLAEWAGETRVTDLLGVPADAPRSVTPAVPDDVAQKVRALVPKGWSVQVVGDALLVSRDEQVWLTNTINMDVTVAEDLAEGHPRDSIPEHYVLILRFAPLVSPAEYARLAAENQAAEAKLEVLYKNLWRRLGGKFDSFADGESPDPEVQEYQRLRASIHDLPARYIERNSIWIGDSVSWGDANSDGKECEAVREKVTAAMGQAYPPAHTPATEPATRAAATRPVEDKPISVQKMIEVVSQAGLMPRGAAYPNWGGRTETDVQIRLSWVSWDSGYQPRKADEPILLAAMANEKLDLPARLCVARYLLDLNNAESRKFVEAQLAADSPSEAASALLAYARPGHDWAIEQMIALIKTDKLSPKAAVPQWGYASFVRRDLITRLGELNVKGAAAVLIEDLKRHPYDREIAYALGHLGDRAAIPVLLEQVEQGPRFYSAHASALVSLKSDKVLPIILRHLDDTSINIFSLLDELNDPKAIEPLRAWLKGHPSASGSVALARLELHDPAELATRLIALLEAEPDGFDKCYLIEALGKTRDPRAVAPIAKTAETTKDFVVLSEAFDALGAIKTDEALRALVALMSRDYSNVNTGKPLSVTFPELIVRELKAATGQDFGLDSKAWATWLAQHPATRAAAGESAVPVKPAEFGLAGTRVFDASQSTHELLKNVFVVVKVDPREPDDDFSVETAFEAGQQIVWCPRLSSRRPEYQFRGHWKVNDNGDLDITGQYEPANGATELPARLRNVKELRWVVTGVGLREGEPPYSHTVDLFVKHAPPATREATNPATQPATLPDSLEKVPDARTKYGGKTVVAAEAMDEAFVIEGYEMAGNRLPMRQSFKVVAALRGDIAAGQDITVDYVVSNEGARERPIRKSERVIWILGALEAQTFWQAEKALEDTADNRKLVAAPATKPAATTKEIDSPSSQIYRGAERDAAGFLTVGRLEDGDAEFMRMSADELFTYIIQWRGATGEGDRAVTCFMHKTADRADLRRKIVAELGARVKQSQSDCGSLHSATDDKMCWITCLAKLGAHDELVAAMEREPGCETCCGWNVFVPIIVSFGRIEDAWTLVRKIEQPGGDGSTQLLNGALEKLTGHVMSLPVPAKYDDEGRRWQHRELARLWTEYLNWLEIVDRGAPAFNRGALPGSQVKPAPIFSADSLALAVMEADERPMPEELSQGGRLVCAQKFTVKQTLGGGRLLGSGGLPETLRLTYRCAAGERPIAQGEPVVWIIDGAEQVSNPANAGTGIRAFADDEAGRKTAAELLKAATTMPVAGPGKAELLPGSHTAMAEAMKARPVVALVEITAELGAFSDRTGVTQVSSNGKVVEVLRGNLAPGEVKFGYTVDGRCAERSIAKGERVLWLLAPADKAGSWEGKKALADTPANRELVAMWASERAPGTQPTSMPAARSDAAADAAGASTQPPTDPG